MSERLTTGFASSLWQCDLARLPGMHRKLAEAVFAYATDSLGSEPFQRESSRTGRSDGQTIFRTTLHRSFWLVLDTKSGGLQLHFPDKDDVIHSRGIWMVEHSPGTQWTRKKEKRVRVPPQITEEGTAGCLALVDEIHDAAVEYYSRGKDFSLTLRTLLGPPTDGVPLKVPDAALFAALLGAGAGCKACGARSQLSLYADGDRWELYCDHHHPLPSAWAAIGREVIPFEVKRAVWHRDGGRCVSCGSESYATFDHIIPANRGGGTFSGSNLEANIRLKCRTCNYSKGNKLIP